MQGHKCGVIMSNAELKSTIRTSVCRLSADLGALIGLSPGPAAHEPSPGSSPAQSLTPTACPFPMPLQYEDAKEGKVQTVASLRNSINRVCFSQMPPAFPRIPFCRFTVQTCVTMLPHVMMRSLTFLDDLLVER